MMFGRVTRRAGPSAWRAWPHTRPNWPKRSGTPFGMPAPADLVRLAQFFGDPANDLCILAEGNVSCRGDAGTLWIKASGAQMGRMADADFVEARTPGLLRAMDSPPSDEVAVRALLNAEQVD